MLRLLSLLQTPRAWTGAELAGRLEVVPRTVRRDIERLRALGYPVHATRGAVGGYRLKAGTAMPPLLLDDAEAVAVAVSLRSAAASPIDGFDETALSALAKLEQVLPKRLRGRVAALQAATTTLPASGPRVDPTTLTAIAAAATAGERVRFSYRAKDGTGSERLVEPHSLVNAGRRWYLIGYDTNRDDWRTFRIDRITDLHCTGIRQPSRDLPAPDAAAYLADTLYAHLGAQRADVTLHAPIDTVADRLSPHAGVLEPVDQHTCRLRTSADSIEYLAFRIALLGVEFEVHHPPELIAYLHALRDRLTHALP